MDDLRCFGRSRELQVFADKTASKELRTVFDYIFSQPSQLRLREITSREPIEINGISVVPVPMMHGNLPTTGYRIGKFAYLTDANYISDESIRLLEGVQDVVIDGLQAWSHPTHFSFKEAIEVLTRFRPKRAWMTHICHSHSHMDAAQMVERLRSSFGDLADCTVDIAYDGLQFEVDVGPC
jgi:phosphoribosyl 1,2-cyclic phosphate phosphodiesterase